jgi:CRISPR-associated endonuclease/helicase Cas3
MFDEFFATATGVRPFPFQRRLGLEDWPSILNVPTGLGKTAATVLAWAYKRRAGDATTPRRLVYCLPMRVLVEQVRDNTVLYLHRLGLLAGTATVVTENGRERVSEYKPSWKEPGKIAVTVLMGGEEAESWDRHPESDAIIIGTQDMLLSRALNRGYGMSRYRWPIHFGLLNSDALWVIDEVQLFGSGLATTTQLQGFRESLGTLGPARTLWVSATVSPDWLRTVDFTPPLSGAQVTAIDKTDEANAGVSARINARKKLHKSKAVVGVIAPLAKEILANHQPSTRTLVVTNTVKRAVETLKALAVRKPKADLVLIHSRFRPRERAAAVQSLLRDPGPGGTIVVSTQVVEAGVDVSARTLFTEACPWASFVQRVGRCNRSGEFAEADVFWVGLPEGEKAAASVSPPYAPEDITEANGTVDELKDVGPNSLKGREPNFQHGQVLRRKDLVELFDTTQDLAGYDVDISRFIRSVSETDVRVFWRDIPADGPSADEPPPSREELCPAPLHEVRKLVEEKKIAAWCSDHLEGGWMRTWADSLFPGMTLMLASEDGRYGQNGWDAESREPVPAAQTGKAKSGNDYDSDEWVDSPWDSVNGHTAKVMSVLSEVLGYLPHASRWSANLREAVTWHDTGKAHPSFQAKLIPGKPELAAHFPVAKAPRASWRRDSLPAKPTVADLRRRHFRHELVSALLALANGKDDLVAYLVAAHHGKVRLSIRSMPGESRPEGESIRFARGVWDGDKIPAISLGEGLDLEALSVSLDLMELGQREDGTPSWAARAIGLRDSYEIGPFSLAFLEALVRAADERGSGGE